MDESQPKSIMNITNAPQPPDSPKLVRISFNVPAIIFMVLLLAIVGFSAWFSGYSIGKIFAFRDLDRQTKLLKKEFANLEWNYEGMRQWLALLDGQQVRLGLPPAASVMNLAVVAKADSMLTVIDSLKNQLKNSQPGPPK